jgi:hypothetical protein
VSVKQEDVGNVHGDSLCGERLFASEEVKQPVGECGEVAALGLAQPL